MHTAVWLENLKGRDLLRGLCIADGYYFENGSYRMECELVTCVLVC